MAEPVWHRIHPLTIIIELWRVMKQFFIAVAYLAFSLFTGGGAGMGVELIGAGLGFLILIPALARYYSFGYAINDGKLLVRSGIVTKNLRTIPLDRIQNINLTRNLLHRVLGLVDLEIETASSAKAEASISALTEEQAKILKAQLMREVPKLTSFVHEEARKKIVYKPTNWELFLVGASENRLLAIIAAILGLGFIGPQIGDAIEDNIENVEGFVSRFVQGWMIGVLLIGLMFFIGWIVSIVSTFVKYYGFELTDEGNQRLKRTYGLLTNIENVLPLRRVQTMVFRQNLFQKKLGICKLFVSTAGGFGNQKQSNEGSVQVPQSPLLTPVLRSDAFPMLANTVFPDAAIVDPEWHRVGKGTVIRHLRSTLIPALILGAATGFWVAFDGSWRFGWQNVAVFFGILGFGLLLGYLHYKFARWADVDGMIISRVGWFSQRINYLPTEKVQAVTVRQSPIQRRFGLATLDLSSAAPTFQTTEVDDLPAEKAEELAYSVHERSGRGHDSLVDGF